MFFRFGRNNKGGNLDKNYSYDNSQKGRQSDGRRNYNNSDYHGDQKPFGNNYGMDRSRYPDNDGYLNRIESGDRNDRDRDLDRRYTNDNLNSRRLENRLGLSSQMGKGRNKRSPARGVNKRTTSPNKDNNRRNRYVKN